MSSPQLNYQAFSALHAYTPQKPNRMSDTESDSASAPAAMPIVPPTIRVKKAKPAEHPILEQFKVLTAEEQANLLKHMGLAHEKTLKQALKDASKAKKTKKVKDPDAPKRPQSEANKAWIAYVKQVKEETGLTYGEAMKEASTRREAGDPAAPAKAAPKPAKAPKVPKAAPAPAAPAPAAPAPAKKTVKVPAPAAPAPAPAAAPASAKKPAPVPAPAPTPAASSKEDKKAAKKAAKAAKKAAKAAPAPAPAPAEKAEDSDAEADDANELSTWTHKSTNYYRSPRNELWKQNPDNTLGAWVGIYNPTTDKIDSTAPEPVLEE